MKRLGLLAACVISYCTVVFADGKLLSIADVLNWKQLQSAVVSGDGAWFAYHAAPNEGDAELVLRNLKDGKETRFPVGVAPAGPPPFLTVAAPSSIRFSEDSKWLAFAVFPKVAEAKKAKREKKTVAQQNGFGRTGDGGQDRVRTDPSVLVRGRARRLDRDAPLHSRRAEDKGFRSDLARAVERR